MRSILDPTFKYVPAASTDLRKTFARIRREEAARKAEQDAALNKEREAKVTVLRKK